MKRPGLQVKKLHIEFRHHEQLMSNLFSLQETGKMQRLAKTTISPIAIGSKQPFYQRQDQHLEIQLYL